jgi:hypothetical protein
MDLPALRAMVVVGQCMETYRSGNIWIRPLLSFFDGEAIMSKERELTETENKERELTINELDAVSGGDVLLSNVSKTRSEISMTFARNSRA